MLSPIFQDSKERTDFFIALVVVALFGTFMGYQFWDDRSDGVDNLKSLIANNVEEDDTKPFLIANLEASNLSNAAQSKRRDEIKIATMEETSPTLVDSVSAVVTEAQQNITSATEQIASEPIIETDTTTILNEEGITVIKDEPDDNTPSSSGNPDIKTSGSETIVPTPPAPSTTTSVVKNIVEGKDCRIIVGSYRLKSSRDSMLEKLAKTNFQVVTYREKGLNIVAIHHSCDKDELRSTVKTVREKYAKGAFVTGK